LQKDTHGTTKQVRSFRDESCAKLVHLKLSALFFEDDSVRREVVGLETFATTLALTDVAPFKNLNNDEEKKKLEHFKWDVKAIAEDRPLQSQRERDRGARQQQFAR